MRQYRSLFVGVLVLLSSVARADGGAVAVQSLEDGDFNGYLRAGAGASKTGAANCYYLGNGDGHGYRLGNECDSYAELAYSKSFAKSPDGMDFIGHVMVADYSANSLYNGNVQISQIFISAVNVPGLNGGTPWMGERYYERPDIHAMDLQYINLNGTGAGIDNILAGPAGKFSYAIFKDNDNNNYTGTGLTSYTSSNSAIRNNVLFRDVPLYPGGTMDFIAGYLSPVSQGTQGRHSGYNLHLFYHQDFLGGANTVGGQYGVGPGTGRGDPGTFDPNNPAQAFNSLSGSSNVNCCNRMGSSGSTLLGSSDTRLRVFDTWAIQPTENFGAAFDLVYQADKSPVYAGGKSVWVSYGFRPEYAFTEHLKLQGEIGVDRVSYPNAALESLAKFTIAPTFSLGKKYYDRPELRLFYTYAQWNSAAINTINANNYANTAAIGTATSGTTIGAQIEAWWGTSWF